MLVREHTHKNNTTKFVATGDEEAKGQKKKTAKHTHTKLINTEHTLPLVLKPVL